MQSYDVGWFRQVCVGHWCSMFMCLMFVFEVCIGSCGGMIIVSLKVLMELFYFAKLCHLIVELLTLWFLRKLLPNTESRTQKREVRGKQSAMHTNGLKSN